VRLVPGGARRNRGIVLLLVLGAVAVLTALAVDTAHRSTSDVTRAARAGREAGFRRVFDAGIAVGQGLVAEKRIERTCDYFGDPWHREVRLELGAGEWLALRVEDEAGKLNLLRTLAGREDGALARKSLARLFDYLRHEDPEREKEWTEAERAVRMRLGLKEDQKTGVAQPEPKAGAKPAPEPAPESPLTLDGLREAGVPLELLFGRASREQPFGAGLALCDVLTVFGDGRVNLNTAPAAVLFALDEEYDARQVDRIVDWRGTRAEAGGAEKARPFRAAADLELVAGIVTRAVVDGRPVVIRNLLQKVQSRVTVRSKVFSVRMTAEIDGRLRQAWAFLEALDETERPAKAEPVRLLGVEEIEP